MSQPRYFSRSASLTRDDRFRWDSAAVLSPNLCASAACLLCICLSVHPRETWLPLKVYMYERRACARAARSIFGHFSGRMHLGRRYKFSQAGMIARVSSLSFFSYYQFRILCSPPLRPPSCSTAATFVNKRQIASEDKTARAHVKFPSADVFRAGNNAALWNKRREGFKQMLRYF